MKTIKNPGQECLKKEMYNLINIFVFLALIIYLRWPEDRDPTISWLLPLIISFAMIVMVIFTSMMFFNLIPVKTRKRRKQKRIKRFLGEA